MNCECVLSSARGVFLLIPFGLLSACGERMQAPIATTVCELPAYAQRMVQLDAEISVDRDGRTVIGDARCATTKIELQLSAAATRAGAAEQLEAAAQSATSSGKPSFSAKLTGVFTHATTGTYFIAESISGLPTTK